MPYVPGCATSPRSVTVAPRSSQPVSWRMLSTSPSFIATSAVASPAIALASSTRCSPSGKRVRSAVCASALRLKPPAARTRSLNVMPAPSGYFPGLPTSPWISTIGGSSRARSLWITSRSFGCNSMFSTGSPVIALPRLTLMTFRLPSGVLRKSCASSSCASGVSPPAR